MCRNRSDEAPNEDNWTTAVGLGIRGETVERLREHNSLIVGPAGE